MDKDISPADRLIDAVASSESQKAEIKSLKRQIEMLQDQLSDARSSAKKVPRVRPRKSKRGAFFTSISIPDSHGSHIDNDAAAAFLADLKAIEPEEIVMLGDHVDCGGFLAQHHTLGYVAESEYTYEDDILAANRFLDAIQEAAPNATIHYLEGNHECLHPDHEVLTSNGWVDVANVTTDHTVAALKADGAVSWERPTRVHQYDFDGDLVSYDTPEVSGLVTPNHRMAFYGAYRKDLRYRCANSMCDFRQARADVPAVAVSGNSEFPITDDEIRVVAWLLTDGNINAHMAINQSKEGNLSHIRRLLSSLGVTFSERVRHRSARPIAGVPVASAKPAHVFSILGKDRARMAKLLGIGNWNCREKYDKRLPGWCHRLSDRQFRLFLHEVIRGDGSMASNGSPSFCIYGAKEFLSDLQMCMVTHGVRGNISRRKRNGKEVYWALNGSHRTFATVTSQRCERVPYRGPVHCLTMPSENFFVRRNGKVHVTGNSRIEKWAVTQALSKTQDADFLRRLVGPETLLNLKSRGIPFYRRSKMHMGVPVPGTIKLGKRYYTHQANGKHAAATIISRMGASVFFGHIHREQMVTARTLQSGAIKSGSPGCLCQLQPLYMHTNVTDWCHGYGVIEVSRNSGTFCAYHVPIIDGVSYLPRPGVA